MIGAVEYSVCHLFAALLSSRRYLLQVSRQGTNGVAAMRQSELTMLDVMHDPIIRQILRADRVSLAQFAVLLQDTARKLKSRDPSVVDSEETAPAPNLQ